MSDDLAVFAFVFIACCLTCLAFYTFITDMRRRGAIACDKAEWLRRVSDAIRQSKVLPPQGGSAVVRRLSDG